MTSAKNCFDKGLKYKSETSKNRPVTLFSSHKFLLDHHLPVHNPLLSLYFLPSFCWDFNVHLKIAWVVNETLTPNCENDVEAGTATNDFVDDGEIPERSNSKPKSSMMTGPPGGLAKEEKVGRKLYLDTVKAE